MLFSSDYVIYLCLFIRFMLSEKCFGIKLLGKLLYKIKLYLVILWQMKNTMLCLLNHTVTLCETKIAYKEKSLITSNMFVPLYKRENYSVFLEYQGTHITGFHHAPVIMLYKNDTKEIFSRIYVHMLHRGCTVWCVFTFLYVFSMLAFSMFWLFHKWSKLD